MIELRRLVRFCLAPGDDPSRWPPRSNTFAAWPPLRGLGRFFQLHVVCRGQVDPLTGYFLNIKHIDQAVRQRCLPVMQRFLDLHPLADAPLGACLQQMAGELSTGVDHSLASLQLDLTPHHSLTLELPHMTSVVLRQMYDFCAAHRLHVPTLSDQQNRELFGKCNNPSGHGHNYRIEVAVRTAIDSHGRVVPLERIDHLVDEHLIQHFDHKNLNVDVNEFRTLNPSVENIARVAYDRLKPVLSDAASQLVSVTVWETDKTRCTYPA